QRRTLGREHPDTLGTQARIGKLLHDQGKLAESEAMIRGALEISRRTQGAEAADTLDMIGMLALTLGDEEKYAESNALYKEKLDVTARALGKEHFVYLVAASGYANSLLAQGGADQLAEAELLLREVVQTRQRVSGPAHPETIYAEFSLGKV